jgi:hypothetical protein
MACPLPKVVGTLSDSAELGWQDLDQTVTQMLFKNVVTDDFANLNNWTETDADGKVNLSNGVVTMDGGSSWTTHGLILTDGVTRGEGYFEIKFSTASVGASSGNVFVGPKNDATLSTVAAGFHAFLMVAALADGYNELVRITNSSPIVINTWYTLRNYVLKSNDGTTWKKVRFTIQGGVYVDETTIAEFEFTTTAYGTPLYYHLNRYWSNPTGLASFKEFRWYSGYGTDAPYVEFIHDAGVGKVFDNFDRTAMAMPAAMSSANLTFADSFDDGAASYGSPASLATWAGTGKTTARKRYIRIRVYSNSDGATRVYAAKPNSATATDGIGDWAALDYVLDTVTNQGAVGTYDHNKIYTASDSIDPGVSHVDVDVVASYKINGSTKTPTLSLSAEKTAYENSRNSGAATNKIITGQSIVQKGTTYNGSAASGGVIVVED